MRLAGECRESTHRHHYHHPPKQQDIWQLIVDCKSKMRWAQIQETENKELRSALRAEKAHVELLKRKLDLLQALIPAS